MVAGDECAEKLPLTPGQIQRRHIQVALYALQPSYCLYEPETSEEEVSLQSMQGKPAADDTASSQPGRLFKYRRWLGHWKPEYDYIRTETELALHAIYSEDISERIGNEPVVQALKELMKYEMAMLVSDDNDDKASVRTEAGSRSTHDNSLVYSRAAAMVRACQFKIDDTLQPEEIPFCGEATANKIKDIARSGTTSVLEAHRANEVVCDSSGKPRADTGGGATRRLFMQLPGVGAKTAKIWYDLGYRTYEDLDGAIDEGDVRSEGGRLPISYEQAFSLQHRADLLEALPASDLTDMQAAVTEALQHVTGDGEWEMIVVGGGRRSLPSHDGDFVITHPTRTTEGVVRLLVQRLVDQKRLVPAKQAMCRISEGRMPAHLDHMREHVVHGTTMNNNNIAVDRFDKVFGMFMTKSGKVRRMDLIITPHEEYPFCLLGWTGSKQYLRFLRQHAGNCNMLMRREGQQSCVVPQEGAPYDRNGKVWWPPGWGEGRVVMDEGDIMELLGVPRREPHERNCP
ncbi:MAG: DNA-directed DNA RNA polymerase mu [Trebouxia sp. A1-2]|nr:MAG: DNA-directed DNA RNA polymerase mu [Trebouxia sp. A1-2]